MAASRPFYINDVHNGMNFQNLDDMEPPPQRFSPIVLSSYNQEYQQQEIGNDDKRPISKSDRSKVCSKRCLIGLGIGLGIGCLITVAIAVPLGVIPRCGVGIISSTPNWIGTFLMDNQCDTTRCCCLTNYITLTQPSSNLLQIAGSVTGQCAAFTSTIALTQQLPSTFQALITWSGDAIRLQLGQDSNYLSFVNTRRALCSTTALRTSYNAGSMKSMNLVLVIFILPITIGLMQ